MSTSRNKTAKPITETKSCNLVHKCKKCAYRTKSLFFIRNHVKRHRDSNSVKLFNCTQSTPEIFTCKECNFKTWKCVPFKNHLKVHNFIFQISYNLQNKTKRSDNLENSEAHEIVWSLNLNETEESTNFETYKICKQKSQNHNKPQLCKSSPEAKFVVSGRQFFFCDKCPYKGKIESDLKRHIMYVHADGDELTSCFICRYKTRSRENLKKHMIREHSVNEDIEWFHCDKCEYKTRVEKYLGVHMVTKHMPSTKIKWLQCDQCPFKTQEQSNLSRHIGYNHTDMEVLFPCNTCPYVAKHKQNLRRHMMAIHNIKI